MRLTDIMSAAGLSGYAEVALIIFMLVFAGIVIYVFRRGSKQRYERASRIPLESDLPGGDTASDGRGAAS